MNKKFLYGAAVIVIVAIAALNINVSLNTNKLPDLSLANVEAVAGEWSFWDALGNLMSGQGLKKDEREIQERCPTEQSSGGSGNISGGNGAVGGSASGSGNSNQKNPPERTDIRCAVGNENCDEIKC